MWWYIELWTFIAFKAKNKKLNKCNWTLGSWVIKMGHKVTMCSVYLKIFHLIFFYLRTRFTEVISVVSHVGIAVYNSPLHSFCVASKFTRLFECITRCLLWKLGLLLSSTVYIILCCVQGRSEWNLCCVKPETSYSEKQQWSVIFSIRAF